MEQQSLAMWDTAQTAAATNIPAATLRWWRYSGTGPRSFRVGSRKVMYRQADVIAWLEGQYGRSSVGGEQ